MDPITIITATAKLITVVQALIDAAPEAEATLESAVKAYELLKNVFSKHPTEVTQTDLDPITAMAEQIESDILDTSDPKTA